jgi:hypothetical protein
LDLTAKDQQDSWNALERLLRIAQKTKELEVWRFLRYRKINRRTPPLENRKIT